MRCPRNTLYIRLKGRGVQPVISLSVEDGVLDLGDALVGDTISSSFKVTEDFSWQRVRLRCIVGISYVLKFGECRRLFQICTVQKFLS